MPPPSRGTPHRLQYMIFLPRWIFPLVSILPMTRKAFRPKMPSKGQSCFSEGQVTDSMKHRPPIKARVGEFRRDSPDPDFLACHISAVSKVVQIFSQLPATSMLQTFCGLNSNPRPKLARYRSHPYSTLCSVCRSFTKSSARYLNRYGSRSNLRPKELRFTP